MTGQEFYLQLQQKYDKAYSQYLDNTKANRLVSEAMSRLVDKLYMALDDQKGYDELIEFIKNDVSIAVATGKITLPADYLHLFRLKFIYADTITFTGGALGEYTAAAHTLRIGDVLNSAIDGTGTSYTITNVKKGKFYLATASVASPLYLRRSFEASPAFSDRKKGSLSNATKESPKYQMNTTGTNREISCSPAPYSAIVDYMVKPPHTIDVANNVTDLLDFYTDKFLYRLMDECVYEVANETRDFANKQSVQQTIIENP